MKKNLIQSKRLILFLLICAITGTIFFGLLKANNRIKDTKVSIKGRNQAIELVRLMFPEVKLIGLPKETGAVNVYYLNDGYKLVFWEGSGDCQLGCIDIHEWYFVVTKTGVVQKIGEYQRQGGVEKGKKLADFFTESDPKEGNRKIDSQILLALREEDQVSFFIEMEEKADLSSVELIKDPDRRGKMVYEQLISTATRTQAPIIKLLQAENAEFQIFYIDNIIKVVTSNEKLIHELAARADVSSLRYLGIN